MAQGMEKDIQTDFSAGAHPLYARDLIPLNGFEDGVNCLLTEDGLPTRRGGSTYKGSDPAAALGALAANPGRWMWDGYLAAGRRSVQIVMSSGGAPPYLCALSPVDDTTVVLVQGAIGTASYLYKPTLFKNVLVLPNGLYYAGYVDAGVGNVPSGVGSITLTNGSSTVVGAGTAWTAGARPAGLFIEGADPLRRPIIKSVTDGTHLELAEPWDGATVTKIAGAWSLVAITTLTQPAPAGYALPLGVVAATVGTKLFSAAVTTAVAGGALPPNRIYQSPRGQPWQFKKDDYWDLPDGTEVGGIEALSDTAIVFSNRGVYAIYNTARDLTDALGNVQQRLEAVDGDLMLWSAPGVAAASGRLVVPAVDDIYLWHPASGRQKITGGIGPLYRNYIESGYRAGHAIVYRNHYLLPILSPASAWVDTLKCRLEPTRRGHAYGWTRAREYGGQIAAFAVRTTAGSESLLGIQNTSGRVLNLEYFDQDSPTDADGTEFTTTVTTREFRVTNGVKNFLQRLRVRYSLLDGGGTPPTMTAKAGVDGHPLTALTLPTTSAPDAAIDQPATWLARKRGYGVRFELTVLGSAGAFLLHSVESWIRSSGRR